MTRLNRDEIVSLLARLGETDDAEVLRAARKIHELMVASGASWEDLLIANDQGSNPNPVDLDNSEIVALIEQLLGHDGIADTTREELDGYKDDVAEGDFTDADGRYLQALAARLSLPA